MLKVEKSLISKIAICFVLLFVVGLQSLWAETLEVGESKTVTIYANRPYNYTHIYLQKDKKYKFTVSSPAWNNGIRETDAGGYVGTDTYNDSFRRHPEYKMMALVGEIYTYDNSETTWTGYSLLIGLGRSSYTVPKAGYLVPFANDIKYHPVFGNCYLDNSRIVELTIKRIE
jgi:hypothetical protein